MLEGGMSSSAFGEDAVSRPVVLELPVENRHNRSLGVDVVGSPDKGKAWKAGEDPEEFSPPPPPTVTPHPLLHTHPSVISTT